MNAKITMKKIVLDEKTVEDLLAINVHNRPNSRARVASYVEMMRSGDFVFASPQAVTFTVNASMTRLIDGQTRLAAIKESGCYGREGYLAVVPDEQEDLVFASYDVGRIRTSGATLTAQGVVNGNQKAAVARILLKFFDGPSIKNIIPNALVNRFVVEKDSFLSALPITSRATLRRDRPPAPVLAGLANAIRLKIATLPDAVDFFNGALRDKGEENSAQRLLSRYIAKVSRATSDREAIAVVTKLVRYHFCGVDCEKLYIRESDYAFALVRTPSAWDAF